MNNKKIDLFIKQNLQKDKNIDIETKDFFKNFEEDLKMKNKEIVKRTFKISFKMLIAVTASVIIIVFVGANLYIDSIGKPNAISAIKALLHKEKEKKIVGEENTTENEENIYNPEGKINETITTNVISKDDAYAIIKSKYISTIEKIYYINGNIKQNGKEYYQFGKEQINLDGSHIYLSTILISLDGIEIKEIYDPNGTKSQNTEYTEEQKQEIIEDKYNAQAKEAINKFFKLRLQSSPDELLMYLGLTSDKINVPVEERILENGLYYKQTPLTYSEFKNKMLQYMTESMFNEFIYLHVDLWYKNIEGKLWIADYRAEGTNYHAEALELISINGNIYEYFVKYKEEGGSYLAVRTMYLEIVNGKVRMSNTDM